MTVSARDVAAALRQRLPGVPTKKLHKLLYYAQGHHLATFGRPLFAETISAWDMGPVVGQLWKQEKDEGVSDSGALLGEAELNTVGYVVSRYGALTGRDLENLTHSESPWRRADSGRIPRASRRIENEWMAEYFRTAGAAGDDEDELPLDSDEIARLLAGAEDRRHARVQTDNIDDLRQRLTGRV